MKRTEFLLLIFLLYAGTASMAQTIPVSAFDKVIISPHIEVKLIQGAEEAVSIEKTSVNKDKINIEVKGNTLRIYLDDAKEVTKNEPVYQDGNKRKIPIYKGTQLSVTITFKDMEELSVRGEESVVVEGLKNRKKFRLKVYGEPTLIFNELYLDMLKATIYGTGNVKIASGTVKVQKYTAYGEAKVDALEVLNNTTMITSYGAAHFQINTSEELKVTAYGDALVEYRGDPKIRKGLVIGELKIRKFQKNIVPSDLSEKDVFNNNIPQL